MNFVDPSGESSKSVIDTDKINYYDFISNPEYNYNRNTFNTNIPQTYNDAINSKWIQLPNSQSIYHSIGLPDGVYNSKFISQDGHKEAVYNYYTKNLVTDDKNIGTYNYYPPNDALNHTKYDVIPYFLYGNSPNDTTTTTERIFQSTEFTKNIYNTPNKINNNLGELKYNFENFNQLDFINKMDIYFSN